MIGNICVENLIDNYRSDQEPNRYAKAKDIGDGRACFQYSRSRSEFIEG